MSKYVETRSARALAIDRSKNAKTRYDEFNSKYSSSPNTSDVEDYDTRTKVIPPPKSAVVKEDKSSDKEYIPSSSERKSLVKYFNRMSFIDQHKDLLTTKNVVRNKSDVQKWKKNPKAYDIRGIDTQPKELIEKRLEVVNRYIGNIPIIKPNKENRLGARSLAEYRFKLGVPSDKGVIVFSNKMIAKAGGNFTYNSTIAHELGHAYDRVVMGKNTGFFGSSSLSSKYKSKNNIWDNVEKVTRLKISPYDKEKVTYKYRLYRTSNKELFADWFSGYINNKSVVKKDSRQFYNLFKKNNKGIYTALKQSDLNVTSFYIKKKK